MNSNKKITIAIFNTKGGSSKTSTLIALLNTITKENAYLNMTINRQRLQKYVIDCDNETTTLTNFLNKEKIKNQGYFINKKYDKHTTLNSLNHIKDFIENLPNVYELVFIDCPNKPEISAINKIKEVSDLILIPLTPSEFTTNNMSTLFERFGDIKDKLLFIFNKYEKLSKNKLDKGLFHYANNLSNQIEEAGYYLFDDAIPFVRKLDQIHEKGESLYSKHTIKPILIKLWNLIVNKISNDYTNTSTDLLINLDYKNKKLEQRKLKRVNRENIKPKTDIQKIKF